MGTNWYANRCKALVFNPETRKTCKCNGITLKGYPTCKEHTKLEEKGGKPSSHSLWSAWMPPRLLDTYEQLLADPDPFNLLQQYTFLHTLAIDKLSSLNGTAPLHLWAKVRTKIKKALTMLEESGEGVDEELNDSLEEAIAMLEKIGAIRDSELDLRSLIREMGTLVEVETRRAERQKAYITPEQAMALVAALTTVIMNAIEETDPNDPEWKDKLRERIARDFIRICTKSSLQKTNALEDKPRESLPVASPA